MGMFDHVECPPELLPDGYDAGEWGFQSKDFACELTSYRIAPEGRFEFQIWDDVKTGLWYYWDFEPKSETHGKKVYVDTPTAPPGVEIITLPNGEELEFPAEPHEETERQNYRWVEYHNRDGSLFTGQFNFYTNGRGDDDRWHEYTATFEDGQLVSIVDDSERTNRFFKRRLEKGHDDEETA